jgi:type III pantothenate kinase
MTPDVVVDVGNSRIKWGRCGPGAVVESVALPPASPEDWQRQLHRWGITGSLTWALAGVYPARMRQLGQWLTRRADVVRVIDDPRELPLRVALERPDHVGIDRLMDAVAVNGRRDAARPAVVIDAGSAVTVDWLDEEGTFQGGAILPGFRLLAQSLHDYTALLPLIEAPRKPPPLPGQSTPAAIEAGVYWSAAGGIAALIAAYGQRVGREPEVYLTGGDALALLPALPSARHWPEMTLEGIRLTAEVLP